MYRIGIRIAMQSDQRKMKNYQMIHTTMQTPLARLGLRIYGFLIFPHY